MKVRTDKDAAEVGFGRVKMEPELVQDLHSAP